MLLDALVIVVATDRTRGCKTFIFNVKIIHDIEKIAVNSSLVLNNVLVSGVFGHNKEKHAHALQALQPLGQLGTIVFKSVIEIERSK